MLLAYSFASAEGEKRTDGALRVFLKSLGEPAELNVRLAGDYSLDGDAGMRFDRDTTLTLLAQQDAVFMKVGGFTMRLGNSVTFARHPSEGETGAYIEGSAKGGLYMGDLTVSAQGGALRCVLTIDIED